MPYYPQSATGLNYISYPAGPTATAATLTASGSTHTKGAYTQFVASSPFACNLLQIEVVTASVSGGLYLFDIATGGSGSETVVVPNIMIDRYSGATSHSGSGFYVIPISIPAGTRISARCQCSTGSGTLEVGITIIAAGDLVSPSTWTQNGVTTATTRGTQVDPGASANTKGAYSQVIASTAAVAQLAVIQFSNIATITAINARWCVDIATGAAASEVVLVPDLRWGAAGVQGIPAYPRSITFLTYIPASTRIAVRASCSSNDSSFRLFDVAILTAVAPNDVTSGTYSRIFSGY